MMKIHYTTFKFIKPLPLRATDFEVLKQYLTKNPKYSLNPKSNFLETFTPHLIMVGVGVVGAVITLFDFAEWVNAIGGFIAIVGLLSIFFSFLPSLFSYFGFLSDKTEYYSKLKRNILRAKDYSEFQSLINQESR